MDYSIRKNWNFFLQSSSKLNTATWVSDIFKSLRAPQPHLDDDTDRVFGQELVSAIHLAGLALHSQWVGGAENVRNQL